MSEKSLESEGVIVLLRDLESDLEISRGAISLETNEKRKWQKEGDSEKKKKKLLEGFWIPTLCVSECCDWNEHVTVYPGILFSFEWKCSPDNSENLLSNSSDSMITLSSRVRSHSEKLRQHAKIQGFPKTSKLPREVEYPENLPGILRDQRKPPGSNKV